MKKHKILSSILATGIAITTLNFGTTVFAAENDICENNVNVKLVDR